MPHHGREKPPFIVRQSGFQMDIREMADLKRYLSQLKSIVKYYREIYEASILFAVFAIAPLFVIFFV